MTKSFPSPVGELHFSILTKRANHSNKGLVSVPCRGTTFLNIEKGFDGYDFPFPSPVGELHFSINFNEDVVVTNFVSVPCRGTTFLNTIPAIPPPVWAHGRDCVGKIFLEK